jgi:hypothetical protein
VFDWIFSFIHLFLLLGIAAYAFYSLVQGYALRFGVLTALLVFYYFLVLHKAVRKEIKRKRETKIQRGTR